MNHHSKNATRHLSRRNFLAKTAQASAALATASVAPSCVSPKSAPGRDGPLYDISLAQWSLHRAFFGQSDEKLDNLQFAEVARSFDINAIEYVNKFFMDKANDGSYLRQLVKRGEDNGVKTLLIMIDGEGRLGDPDPQKRTQAIENHYKWVRAARSLGCHSIRVNAASSGAYEEQVKLAADGLRRLTEYGDTFGINVIVENHGGLSSNGAWLAEVMRAVDHIRCGTLPDFGNFRIRGDEWYDRYKGIAELMPYAKAVSAKSHEFDAQGNETKTDYLRMMKIVLDAGYHGYVGIEFEGGGVPEREGIRLTKALLEKVRTQLSAAPA